MQGEVAFWCVGEVHVAEHEPPASRLHALLDGALVLAVAGKAAQVGDDERIGLPGLYRGEGGLQSVAARVQAAAHARVFFMPDDLGAELSGLLRTGGQLLVKAGAVFGLAEGGNAGVKYRFRKGVHGVLCSVGIVSALLAFRLLLGGVSFPMCQL